MSSQRLRLPSGSLHSGISAHVRTPRQHHAGVLSGCQPAILPHGASSQHERALSKPTTALAQQQRWCGHVCRAQGTDTEREASTSSSSSGSSGAGGPAPEGGESDNRISKTLAGLDALLGVTDAPPKASTSSSSSSANGSASNRDGPLSVGIAKEALNALAEAEAQRLARGDSSKAGPLKDNLEDQFTKIIEKARKMADEQSKKSGNVEAEQQQLRQEFENLMQTMFKTPDMLDKDELKKLKETVFGPMTFWVTEMSPLVGQDRMGIAVRGNLRDDREKVFAHVVQKVKELFGTKYEVLMIEDTEAEVEGAASPESASRGPRVAFQIVPFAAARPPAPQAWQFLVALALAVAFVASTGQLSLLTNVQKLPKETLEYLQNPDSFPTPDGLPPGIENWDPTVYLITTIPLFFAILTSNFFHEVGHIIAAALKGVKLGPSYFIPNPTLGSFGAITQFASLLKNRKDMWDVAAAGPLAGSLAAGTLFFMGLAQSVPGLLPAELLIPISTGLFKGSLGLGTVARAVLGEQALSKPEILVSPLLVAGWCGAITQALNLLPVGSLDGGRMVQASFGKQALALSSFFTYLGLGLGLLGSGMALPFGLYVLICQRTAEKYVQDAVTPAGDPRATATMVAILAAILVLVPIAPEFADALGIGPENPFF